MHAYIYSLSDGSFIFTYTYIINELKAYKFVSSPPPHKILYVLKHLKTNHIASRSI